MTRHADRALARMAEGGSFDADCLPLRRAPDDGQPLEAFTPDFYLPAFDLYIELTTLRQQLVTHKNRKVRLLEQRYPDVRVKILYKRDYAVLVARFGMEDAPARPGT